MNPMTAMKPAIELNTFEILAPTKAAAPHGYRI